MKDKRVRFDFTLPSNLVTYFREKLEKTHANKSLTLEKLIVGWLEEDYNTFQKSLKGTLINTICSEFLKNIVFTESDTVIKNLQNELDKYLSFKTTINYEGRFKDEEGNNIDSISIYFTDENNQVRVCTYTILGKKLLT